MLRQDWSIVEQHELLCLVTLQSRSDLDLRYAFDTCSSDMLIMFAECEFARGLTVPRLFNPDGIKALFCTVEIVRNPGDSCSSIKYRFSETAFTIESFDAVWKKCKSHLMRSERFQDKIREYGMSHWGFCNCIIIDETRRLL